MSAAASAAVTCWISQCGTLSGGTGTPGGGGLSLSRSLAWWRVISDGRGSQPGRFPSGGTSPPPLLGLDSHRPEYRRDALQRCRVLHGGRQALRDAAFADLAPQRRVGIRGGHVAASLVRSDACACCASSSANALRAAARRAGRVRALRSMVLFHDAVAARRAAAVREPGAAMMVRPFVIGGRGEPALGLPPVGRLSALSHITVMHTVPGELTRGRLFRRIDPYNPTALGRYVPDQSVSLTQRVWTMCPGRPLTIGYNG
jgi:hypothetical protein